MVRPEIAKSWRRCELSGGSPDMSLDLSYDDFDRESRLVRAAQDVLDRLAVELDDTRTCVILADGDARIVDRRLGMSSLSKGLDRVRALPGVRYDEQCAGTNGLGTVAEERKPFAVNGSEHFAEQLKHFTCVGVPLVHPITGVLEGILDLTCLASEANELMLPLLLEASREVHDRFVADSSLSEQALLASFLRAARRTRRPVVCLNDHIVITNDAARALAPSDYALLWEHFAVGRDRSLTRVLPHVELSEGRVFDVRMRPVAAGAGVAGAVVELKPPERQRRAGLRAVEPPAPRDAGPSLVGRSDTWRRVVADVDLQARHRQPVLVVGERGVGKLQCALAIHARGSTWSEPVSVLDAAMSVVDREVDWVEPLRARLRQPEGTVVLRHLESLEGRTVMATIALVDAVDAEVGPRLLATITDQRRRDADFGALLDRFDAAIVVPPLRSRPEDVVDLFEAFAHAPGHRSSGSVSPEVLRALMRYRWPGNARELRRVVRAVALRRPSGQLTLDDLPPEIRTDIAPAGLSRIAEIEREAIVTALHDAGGNKQAAAVRLGLSRSTLYRKLGAYGL